MQIFKPTLKSTVRDLQRKEYIKAMKETEYGWKARGKYEGVGCPDDLPFVFESDRPHRRHCYMDCEDCWNYVLKNKWR